MHTIEAIKTKFVNERFYVVKRVFFLGLISKAINAGDVKLNKDKLVFSSFAKAEAYLRSLSKKGKKERTLFKHEKHKYEVL